MGRTRIRDIRRIVGIFRQEPRLFWLVTSTHVCFCLFSPPGRSPAVRSAGTAGGTDPPSGRGVRGKRHQDYCYGRFTQLPGPVRAW